MIIQKLNSSTTILCFLISITIGVFPIIYQYIWRLTALDELKSNLRKEWCEELPNVELFIDLVDRGTKVLSPIKCHPNSEFYFEKIIKWKIDFEKEFIKPHHIVKKTHTKKN